MGSKKKQQVGWTYNGSFAIAICLGPVETLYGIYNGDTPIYHGSVVDRSSADGNGKTTITTGLGLIDFYWGTPTQNVNGILNALTLDLGGGPAIVPMTALRRLCYAVCRDLSFGAQTTPPVLRFDVRVVPSALKPHGFPPTTFATVPEMIFQYLTDRFEGIGIAEDDLDIPSFLDAADVVWGEALFVEPHLNATRGTRELIADLLSYIDGYLIFRNGKIELRLNRPADTTGVPHLTEADLLDEPAFRNEGFERTWNQTVVTFSDRASEWEDATEVYDDAANAAIVGRVVQKEFHFPWVTERLTARKIAQRLGIKGGIPAMFWTIKLKPQWRALHPGDLIKLSYARLGVAARVLRVTEMRRGGEAQPGVEISAIEEQLQDSSTFFVPDEDAAPPVLVDPSGSGAWAMTSTVPRLSWLPPGLKGGKADGVLIAMHRTDSAVEGASIYWTWNPSALEYQPLGGVNAFPAKATVIRWHRVGEDSWLFRLQMASDFDRAWLQTLAGSLDLYAVPGVRLFKSVGGAKDEHQTQAPWLQFVSGGWFELLGGNIVEIELVGGGLGTDDLLLESEMEDGRHPTIHVYLGRPGEFFVHPSDSLSFERESANSRFDADKQRHFKALLRNHTNEQSLPDVTASIYDRDDPTMCPEGTYSTEWGDRAPTTYEILDVEAGATVSGLSAPDYALVEDIDEALAAILNGTATADQILVGDHVDAVLGTMAGSTQQFYNS